MKALFNSEIIDDHKLSMNIEDRAFQYGDGLFETIIIQDNHPDLLPYHLERLKKGSITLGMECTEFLTRKYIDKALQKLMAVNDMALPLRVKILIWRRPGGYYRPTSDLANILITIRKHKPQKRILQNIGIAKSARNYYSQLSEFKTISALKYVMAGLEIKRSGFDDLIILDHNGHLSELTYSNIFWIKQGIYYTPSLQSGCIKGVMRSYLIDQLTVLNIDIKEVLAMPDHLFNCDHVFACNATGISHIKEIEGHIFNINTGLEAVFKF